jgi:hypothetical protein
MGNMDMESFQTGSPPPSGRVSSYSRGGGVTLNINLMQDKEIENLIKDNDKDP